MTLKQKNGRALNAVAYIALTAVSLTMIFPFYWMVTTSLKVKENILQIPPDIVAWPITLYNFKSVFEYGNIFGAFGNSLFVACVGTLGTLFTSSLAAYAFEKIHFVMRKQLYGIFLATFMIPGQLTLIPLYMIFSKIGWTNSFLPLIVPGILLNAYGMFMIKSFMAGIPDSYIEAANIDGANPFYTYSRIVLPLCKPVLVTLGLFTFIGAWNDFMGPLIYLDDETKFTITMLLSTYRSQYNINWGNIMAASTIAITPIAIFYVFTQRFFIEGITMSGMKA